MTTQCPINNNRINTDYDMNDYEDEQQTINSYTTNDILFLNHLNEWTLNVSIIKDTIKNNINNKNSRLIIILINSDLTTIETISNILSKYYSIISNYMINDFFKSNIDCIILLPELYYNNEQNTEYNLLLKSIELIYNKLNNSVNRIYISNQNNDQRFNQFIKSIEFLKPSPLSSSCHNYFNLDCPYPSSSSLPLSSSSSSSFSLKFDYKSIKNIQKYNSIYSGGFFDFLHSGHKTFLSIGSLLSRNKFFISVLSKSSTVLSTLSSPISSPLKCNITPSSSPTMPSLLVPIRSNTSPSILQQQQQPLTPTKCPYNHDGINSITSSKSSIGEIKNFNYEYCDKNNDRLMQPIETRMESVSQFLNLFYPYHNSIEVVTNTRCNDINYCPMTIIDHVDAIIIINSPSSSSNNNTHKINLIREKRNLKLISIHSIEPVECFKSNNKISSSYIRSLLNDFIKNE